MVPLTTLPSTRLACLRLHCLINNAGVFNEERVETEVRWGTRLGMIGGGSAQLAEVVRRAGSKPAAWLTAGPGLVCRAMAPNLSHDLTQYSPCVQDGLEETWAVNVAAPFLLTASLIDLIT